MKKTLFAVSLAGAASLAQAQTWTQLLEDNGRSVTLATQRGVATDGDETAVLVLHSGGGGGPSAVLRAFDSKGRDRPGLSILTPNYPAEPFMPRGISLLNGYRVGWYEQGSAAAPRHRVFLRGPGQSHEIPLSGAWFGPSAGFSMKDVLSDGVGGWLAAFSQPAYDAHPWLHWAAAPGAQPTGINWARWVRGCEQGAWLPNEQLAAEIRFEPELRISVLTRCQATPQQGGGTLAVHDIDPATGSITASRYSPLYDSTTATVVATLPIGGSRFIVDQVDGAGLHTLRIVDHFGDSAPLPVPGGFRAHALVRTPNGGFVVAADPINGTIGTLQVHAATGATYWGEHTSISDLDVADLRWSGDAAGQLVAAYRDGSGYLTLVGLSRDGVELWRRGIDRYTVAPGAAVQFAPGAGADEMLLAAELQLPDGRTAVHVEQFPIDPGFYTIPWP